MPRTALRYAIERFRDKKRKAYLVVPRRPWYVRTLCGKAKAGI
jgi:hypothetical protein